jgi:precorrin-2 dehydrogenase / sirohydrochlorin ferrochelatase
LVILPYELESLHLLYIQIQFNSCLPNCYKMKDHSLTFLPITLNITDKDILLVGGGYVAFQKIRLLLPFTRQITVVGLEVADNIKEFGVRTIEKAYECSDLDGFFLVYAATNLIELNKKVHADAKAKNILVNVVDNVPYCDFVSPAIYKNGPMTVSVGSNATDVMASVRLRDKIKNFLEHDQSPTY